MHFYRKAILCSVSMLSINTFATAETKVAIDTSGSGFAYEFKDSSGELVYWLPSSYQPTRGIDDFNFAKDLTKSATFDWNEKKSIIVISEGNHNFIGNLWILSFGSEEAVPQSIFSDEVAANILAKTNLDIERSRFFFEKWSSDNKLHLKLSLRYRQQKDTEILAATYSIQLTLGDDIVIDSVKRLSDE